MKKRHAPEKAPEKAPLKATATQEGLKLNLGCGSKRLKGFVNVDRFGTPDMTCDLEKTPWPWETGSVTEIVLHHVLEHLGESLETFFGIIKELHRISRDGTVIRVTVPHPRHNSFISDPTHLRPVTPQMLTLFSKRLNRLWAAQGAANSQLALYLDVDFEVENVEIKLDEPWRSMFEKKQISTEQITFNIRHYNNVAEEFTILWRVVKAAPATP